MDVSVVVPFRGGCPHRETAWAWVRSKLEALGLEVIEGHCPDGPWRKAVALADGISRASGGRLVMHDADVLCDGLAEAIAHPAKIVVPHREVHRLTEAASVRYMTEGRGPLDTVERKTIGRAGGGILVFDRDVWEQVPMDPRFAGWGQEDDSWALALRTIFGPWERLQDHHLIHLWHPPQERKNRSTGSKAGRDLQTRYEAADGNPTEMRALLAEFAEEIAA